jgi:hypothetical protein
MRSETRWCWAGDPTYQSAPDSGELRILPDRLDVIYSEAFRLAVNYIACRCLISRQDDKSLEWTGAMHQVFAIDKDTASSSEYGICPGARKRGVRPQRLPVTIKLTHYPTPDSAIVRGNPLAAERARPLGVL